jgi:hypothetical protein
VSIGTGGLEERVVGVGGVGEVLVREERLLLVVGAVWVGWEMDEKYFRSLFNYSILLSF